MPRAQKIIIDTDPGQDDAVAILLALASPELDVLGITAVAGNVPLKLTEKNARKICELGRQARNQGLCRRHPAAGAGSWSPPRRCTARPASTAPNCRSRRCRCRSSTLSTSSSTR